MKKITSLLFGVLILVSEVAFSGPVMTAKIENVRIRPAVAYVKFAGCNKYNRIYLDTAYGKAMFSTALVASTANKQVRVEFVATDGCDSTESEFVFFEMIN